jgi:hypothetical protein
MISGMVKSQNNTICEAIISVIVLYTFLITVHIVTNYCNKLQNSNSYKDSNL